MGHRGKVCSEKELELTSVVKDLLIYSGGRAENGLQYSEDAGVKVSRLSQ